MTGSKAFERAIAPFLPRELGRGSKAEGSVLFFSRLRLSSEDGKGFDLPVVSCSGISVRSTHLSILIIFSDLEEQLGELKDAGLSLVLNPEKCSLYNGPLEEVTGSEIGDPIHPEEGSL